MARMNVSWHIWVSHVTCEWSWHVWMSQGTYERVMAQRGVYIGGSEYVVLLHIWMSHGTYEWVMAHEWIIAHMDESWRIRMHHVLSPMHIWLSHGTWMSHGVYEWVMAYSNASSCAVTYAYMIESWHMKESWRVWMSHGTYEWVMVHMNESWRIRMYYVLSPMHMHHVAMNESSHICMSHVTGMSHVTCHVRMSHVTYE